MPETDFDKNLNFAKTHKNELLPKHFNKYILIKDQQVIDSFDKYESAAEKGIELYGLDSDFLVYYMTDHEPINFVMGAAF
jgi:hypothetical protein